MTIRSAVLHLVVVSMSSPSAALTDFRDRSVSAGDARLKEVRVNNGQHSLCLGEAASDRQIYISFAEQEYICGDMNTSILKTALGRTIVLQHDIVTPRPYSRANLIQVAASCISQKDGI